MVIRPRNRRRANIGSLRNFRRWPRLLLAIVYLLVIFILLIVFRNEYIINNTSSASNSESGGIVFGISLVVDRPQTFLSNLNANERDTNWSTSFLLQSQGPANQIFLDYVSIYENAVTPEFCFTSFQVGEGINVPFQVIAEIEGNSATNSQNQMEFGRLKKRSAQSKEYIFELADQLCLERGKKYFFPHIFLGITSSQTYANLGLDVVRGHRALEFFPFDQQEITLDLTANYVRGDENFSIRPELDVSISQQGWIGVFSGEDENTILHLKRPLFYRIVILVFALIMGSFIFFLNNIIGVAEGFFEVSFGLLLGLWGTHEILIPTYIESSTLIDLIIYVLYMLVIAETVAVFLDEYLVNSRKRMIEIISIVKGNLESERVEIKNPSRFPIDMTGWVLFDRALNKFKFPIFVLGGGRTVNIWTKDGINDANNLHWRRKQEVWNNDEDTIFLEDPKGDAIDNYSY